MLHYVQAIASPLFLEQVRSTLALVGAHVELTIVYNKDKTGMYAAIFAAAGIPSLVAAGGLYFLAAPVAVPITIGIVGVGMIVSSVVAGSIAMYKYVTGKKERPPGKNAVIKLDKVGASVKIVMKKH